MTFKLTCSKSVLPAKKYSAILAGINFEVSLSACRSFNKMSGIIVRF